MKKTTLSILIISMVLFVALTTTILWQSRPSQRLATHLEKAQILKRIGQNLAALKELQKSLVYETHMDAIYAQMAEIYTVKHEYQNALLSYEKAIENNPTHKDYHFKKTKTLMALHQIDLAQMAFENVRDLYPQDSEILKLQAKLLMYQGENEKSFALYAQIHKQNPDDIDVINQLAILYINAKKIEEAKTLLHQATKTHPKNSGSRFLLSRIYFQEKEYENAKKQLTSILALNPNDISALIALGPIEILMGNLEIAKKYALKALQLNPRNPSARYLLAVAYYHLNDFEKAIVQFELASKNWPDSIDLLYKLATSYLIMNQKQQAISEFNKTLKIDPNLKLSHLALAKLRAEQGWYEEVILHCQKIIEQDPNHLETLRLLAKAYLHENKSKEAMKTLEKVVHSDSHSVADLLNLARLNMTKGKFTNAIQLTQNELKRRPQNIELYNFLALIYYNFGDIPKAEIIIQHALQINPNHIASKMSLAEIYSFTGKINKAIAIYKEIIEMKKDASGDARFKMAAFLLKKGENSMALQEYKLLVDQNPESQTLLLTYIKTLIKTNEIKKAREILIPLYEKNPNERLILHLLAIVYEKNADYEAAINILQTFLKSEPEPSFIQRLSFLFLKKNEYKKALLTQQKYMNDFRLNSDQKSQIHLNIGLLYLIMNDIKKATPHLEQASEQNNFPAQISWIQALLFENKIEEALEFVHNLSQNNPILKSELTSFIQYIKENPKKAPELLKTTSEAVLYTQFKRAKEALFVCEKLIEMTDNNVFILHLSSSLLHSLGNLDKQIEINQMIFQQDPTNIIALARLGDLMIKSKKNQKALYYYKQFIEINPDLGWIYLKLAMVQEKLALTQEAILSYQKSIELMPRSPIALNNLAWLYSNKLNNLERSLEYALKAKSLAPKSAAVADTLGWIYLKSERFQEAKTQLEYAIRTLSRNPTVRYHLALAYFKNGLNENAIEELEIALHLQNDFPEADRARKLVLELNEQMN